MRMVWNGLGEEGLVSWYILEGSSNGKNNYNNMDVIRNQNKNCCGWRFF